jgi:hypothetical protein
MIWCAVSEERTGLSFTITAGPRQDSHSRVRFLWDSRPYFTVSDSRLPFSSPSTTRSVTVVVFDSTSTRELSSDFCLFSSLYLLGGRENRHSPLGLHSALLRSPRIWNQFNYRRNHICIVNCHRNGCSVLCFGVVITVSA